MTLPSGFTHSSDMIMSEGMGFVLEKTGPMKSPSFPSQSSWWWPVAKPFVNGGAAGALVESQVPLAYYNVLYLCPFLGKLLHEEEWAAQFKKSILSDPIFKQMATQFLLRVTYSAVQFGSFEILSRKAVAANDGMPLYLYQEACCGLTAGAIKACISSPVYSAFAHMWTNANLPTAQHVNYKNVFHALHHMVVREGVSVLWKGSGLHALKSMAFDFGMLTSYNRSLNYFKESIGLGEITTQLGAGAVSGFFAVACSLPFAHVYVNIKNMRPDAEGKYPYTSPLDCAFKILKSRGPFAFFKGFPTQFSTFTPRVTLTWMALEEIRKLEGSIGL